MALLDDLRQRRTGAREAQDAILTRAADEGRDLAADEVAAYREQVVAQREADDAIEPNTSGCLPRPAPPAGPHAARS